MNLQKSSFIKVALFCLPSMVFAAPIPLLWNEVNLPASSGASCGNGTPYKFFVNPNPLSSNTVVMFEGGGACWTKGSCAGEGGMLGATNPNGLNTGVAQELTQLVVPNVASPILSRVSLFDKVKTQAWNMVYLPYCTGDVHTGNSVVNLEEKDPSDGRMQYFRGYKNAQVVAEWLKKNMSRSGQLLVTGFSAGGAGALGDYITIRKAFNPSHSALLNDSGMLYPASNSVAPTLDAKGNRVYAAPDVAIDNVYPSLKVHNTIRKMWGYDEPNGLVSTMNAAYPNKININDLGTVNTGLAQIFPNDRMGTTVFQQDGVYSDFSYSYFNPQIASLKKNDPSKFYAALNVLWRKDLANFTQSVNNSGSANLGYYIPYSRPLMHSHTVTTLFFNYTAIPELNKSSVKDMIDDVTNPSPYKTVLVWNKTWWGGFYSAKQEYIPVQRSWATTQQQAPDDSVVATAILAVINALPVLSSYFNDFKAWVGLK